MPLLAGLAWPGLAWPGLACRCVTPYIIVPGPWSDSDIEYHADSVAAGLTNNAGDLNSHWFEARPPAALGDICICIWAAA
jgi:hypothetical protein